MAAPDPLSVIGAFAGDIWRRCMPVNVDGADVCDAPRCSPDARTGWRIHSQHRIGGRDRQWGGRCGLHRFQGRSDRAAKSTAYQYAKLGLSCKDLAVGGVSTNIMNSVKDSILDHAALERMGAYHASNPGTLNPIDIANAILFLASDEARHLNGAVFQWIWDGALLDCSVTCLPAAPFS